MDRVTTGLRHLLPALKEMNASARPLSLRELGRLVHLSPGRAQRVFSRLVGESPYRYQWRVRLDRAAVLLASTDEPITDIAFAVGFGSHEAFTRSFRRRFGTSPRHYRNQALSHGRTGAAAATASTVSPCIGLYHQPVNRPVQTSPQRHEEHTVDYEITVKDITPTPMLYMARRVDKDQVAGALGEALPAVYQYVMEQGLPMAGPPLVRHLSQSAAFIELEAGIPVAEKPKPPEPDTGIMAGELPGGRAAVTVHKGPYDSLGDAHMALDRWMAENGETASGAPWEVYLTDPGEVPDPADWLTEITWPIS